MNSTVWHDLPQRAFDVVLADPPWSYYGDGSKDQAAGKHYRCHTINTLATLPVPRLLTQHGVLFVWATSPMLGACLRLISHWGLSYRGVAFVWIKTRRDGGVINAQGVRPSIVKPTAEYVLAASRVAKGRPMKLGSESVPNVVLAPRGEHSEKPSAVHRHIESLYPSATRLELFARNRVAGWQCWGDQLALEC